MCSGGERRKLDLSDPTLSRVTSFLCKAVAQLLPFAIQVLGVLRSNRNRKAICGEGGLEARSMAPQSPTRTLPVACQARSRLGSLTGKTLSAHSGPAMLMCPFQQLLGSSLIFSLRLLAALLHPRRLSKDYRCEGPHDSRVPRSLQDMPCVEALQTPESHQVSRRHYHQVLRKTTTKA